MLTLQHVGTRVGIGTLEMHIESCYYLQSISIPRTSSQMFFSNKRFNQSIHNWWQVGDMQNVFYMVIYIYFMFWKLREWDPSQVMLWSYRHGLWGGWFQSTTASPGGPMFPGNCLCADCWGARVLMCHWNSHLAEVQLHPVPMMVGRWMMLGASLMMGLIWILHIPIIPVKVVMSMVVMSMVLVMWSLQTPAVTWPGLTVEFSYVFNSMMNNLSIRIRFLETFVAAYVLEAFQILGLLLHPLEQLCQPWPQVV